MAINARTCVAGGSILLTSPMRSSIYIYYVCTCGRIASGRSLAVYALAGATTVQAAVEKEAKGLPLGKSSSRVLDENSGKFKLAVGMRGEC